jgi:hypothetical protein
MLYGVLIRNRIMHSITPEKEKAIGEWLQSGIKEMSSPEVLK